MKNVFPKRKFLAQVFPVVEVSLTCFILKQVLFLDISGRKWPHSSQIFLNMVISNWFLGQGCGHKEQREQHT